LEYASSLHGNQFLPVFSGRLLLDGNVFNEEAEIKKWIREKHWVWLPKNSRIIQKDPKTWEYPVGTRVVHQINWNETNPLAVLEIRMLEKLPGGMWAYGAYEPSHWNRQHQVVRLNLRKDERSEDGSGGVGSVNKNERVEIKRLRGQTLQFSRVPTNDCRDCHWFHGDQLQGWGKNLPQELRPSLSGPCGFSPSNQELKPWISSFIRARGYSPIKKSIDIPPGF
jgi:hypothetical protein